MALNVPSQACRPEEELLEQMLSFERTRVVQREVPCRSSRRKRVPTSTSDISMCFARGNVPMDSELLDDVELPKLSELDITSSGRDLSGESGFIGIYYSFSCSHAKHSQRKETEERSNDLADVTPT